MKMLIQYLVLFVCILAVVTASAHSSKKHSHREHKAHHHGHGKLSIAFEGLNGLVDIEIPAESVIGFEHVAKSEADKQKTAAALESLKNKMSEMLVFDPALKCVINSREVKVVPQGKNHSEVTGQFSVQCVQSPLGSDLIFHFHSQFKKIKQLEVQVVVDQLQKSIQVKASGAKLSLK